MPNYYEVISTEYDVANGQQGFNILSGSGTYTYDTINDTTGSQWNKLVAINGAAVLTAQSKRGQDLTANGVTYDSGSAVAVSILQDDEIKGTFTVVKITSGILLAYRG